MQSSRSYFDFNATTPISPEVRAAVPGWLEMFGNPSSVHWGGRGPKTALREARRDFAQAIGADPLEIVFTAGGSEANNLAIKGLFFALKRQKSPRQHYLFTNIEHPSVGRTMEFLANQGADVEVFPVGADGAVDLEAFAARLRPTTALVSVMLANNETGVLLPVASMAKLARAQGALFHSDCVQAFGKIPLSVKSLGVDLASFAGHKFYSLKGGGALYVRKGVQLESLIHGGGQERHRRAGTENVLSLASLGLMSRQIHRVEQEAERIRNLRDHFETRVLTEISDVRVNSQNLPRLPNTSSLVLPGVEGETLLMNLDLEGFAASTGAACSSGSTEPSPVLLAMGLSRQQAQASLRVSMGWPTTQDDVDRFVDALKGVVEHVRSLPKYDIREIGL